MFFCTNDFIFDNTGLLTVCTELWYSDPLITNSCIQNYTLVLTLQKNDIIDCYASMFVIAGATHLFTLVQWRCQGLMILLVHPKTHKVNLRGHEMIDGRWKKKKHRVLIQEIVLFCIYNLTRQCFHLCGQIFLCKLLM